MAYFFLIAQYFQHLPERRRGVFITLQKISQILLILSIGWFLIQLVRAGFRYFQNKLNLQDPDNLEARKRLTQLNMIEKITLIIIAVIFVAIALMSIESLHSIGVSILTSAGVIGIVVGLAAQRSVGQVLSGTNRLYPTHTVDDVVIVEGEWGRIEEINITYAVVRIWDERRLVVPIDYFAKPRSKLDTAQLRNHGNRFYMCPMIYPLIPAKIEIHSRRKSKLGWSGTKYSGNGQ